jgi:hypothetical protein
LQSLGPIALTSTASSTPVAAAPPIAIVSPEIVYSGAPAGSTFEEPARFLPCTGSKQETNFQSYSLGASVAGLSLTAVLRRCDHPYPGEPARANFLSFVYGDCDASKTGSCAPPLEVQSWPACERTLTDYTFDGRPYPYDSVGEARGVPSATFDGGTRIELYSGASTIVVFADDPAVLDSAVDSIRAHPGSPSASPTTELGPASPLTAPSARAVAGDLPCSG